MQSPDDLIYIVQGWRTAFPDLTFDIGAILVKQDLAAARLTHRGTRQNTWRGIAATGRRIEVEEMMFFRFERGQMVEVWEVTDPQAELQQLMTSDSG